MGYHTEFYGKFEFNEPVTQELANYINAFSRSRRMKLDNEKIKELFPNWEKLCFEGKLGQQGEYFIGLGAFGMNTTVNPAIIEMNQPPDTQPGLWCDWTISEDCKDLIWNQAEKTYNTEEWLKYLIDHFFAPKSYILNGEVRYQGEDWADHGIIFIENNIVSVQ